MNKADILSHFPQLKFKASDRFIWSAKKQTVLYDAKRIETNQGQLALLHEIGHAQLKHHDFEFDIELISMEVSAWKQAKHIAKQLKIAIDEDHIQSCLEGYRLWLFKRSLCPVCQNTAVQQNSDNYRCFVCASTWRVAQNRTIQPRRMACSGLVI